jgi:hypothetical protein
LMINDVTIGLGSTTVKRFLHGQSLFARARGASRALPDVPPSRMRNECPIVACSRFVTLVDVRPSNAGWTDE